MDDYVLPRIPERPRDAHKGSFGRVLVLAGSPNMTGAAWLCASAALRAGAGLVTLGVPARIHPWLASRATSEMTLPLPDTKEGTFSWKAVEKALEFLSGVDAFALGPGVTTHPETRDFVRDLVRRAPKAGVVDADGLNNLAGRTGVLKDAAAPRIITPHPGEAARLLDLGIPEVQQDRAVSAKTLARSTGAVVALKGMRTVVSDATKLYINDTGNPGMASGGTGDVLTGVVAGLLAQGFSPFDATALGVWIHGRAGDLASLVKGEAACTAADVLEALAPATREAGEGHE